MMIKVPDVEFSVDAANPTFADWLEWAQVSGEHPTVIVYLSEAGNFRGATPHELHRVSAIFKANQASDVMLQMVLPLHAFVDLNEYRQRVD